MRSASVGNPKPRPQGRVVGGFERHVRRVLNESFVGVREVGFLPERLETRVLRVHHVDLEKI